MNSSLLTKDLNPDEFNDYYFLKEELKDFCRSEGLKVSGSKVGKSFKFKVKFQKWLKANPDKTYQDAIYAYYEIQNSKEKTEIGKQFQYNQYIRDFFEDNVDKSLDDAIKCWKYKKSLKGHNKYEKSDLVIL